MDADDLLEAKIYIGTYRKYNEGSLFGKWLTLRDYSDKEEFYEACKELHKDEEDPEFMFQDWEGLPKGLISESWISETVFELIEQADQMDNFDAFMAFLDFTGYSLEDEDLGSSMTVIKGNLIQKKALLKTLSRITMSYHVLHKVTLIMRSLPTHYS